MKKLKILGLLLLAGASLYGLYTIGNCWECIYGWKECEIRFNTGGEGMIFIRC